MTEKADLLDTILGLRAERYPEIPEDLLTSIIAIEQECLDNRTEANKRIQAAIAEYLQREDTTC